MSTPDLFDVIFAKVLSSIRTAGWSVAVHNDYRLGGAPMTFWGFSKGDHFLKGEGATDLEALLIVADAADIDVGATPVLTCDVCNGIGCLCRGRECEVCTACNGTGRATSTGSPTAGDGT